MMSEQNPVTYSLWASSNLLLEFEGIGVYEINQQNQLVKITDLEQSEIPSDIFYVYYEVSTTGDGSWWIPVSTQPPSSWGDTIELKATGNNIDTKNLVRPQYQFWWIPAEAQNAENLEPIMQIIRGRIVGTFLQGNPDEASLPPEDSTSDLTIDKNPQGGSKITLRKEHLPLLIDIADESS